MESTRNKDDSFPDRDDSAAGINIALLRGINVGGKNRLPMQALIEMFVAAGCDEVRTYIQSGNVLFRRTPTPGEDVSSLVSESILNRFGYRIPIITRTAREFRELVDANPFVAAGADADKLHVAFLPEPPDPARVAALDPNRSPGDQFAVLGREVYLHCPNGFARTKLTNGYFDSALATTSTTRNWRTTLKLLELATED